MKNHKMDNPPVPQSPPAEKRSQIPPYGLMDERYVTKMRQLHDVPADFRSVSQWQDFFDATLKIINDVLWPNYENGAWVGRSQSLMDVLTDADLAILLEMQEDRQRRLDQPIGIAGPGRAGNPTHRQQFEGEDDNGVAFGSNFQVYDPNLPYRLSEQITDVFTRALTLKCGTAELQFKKYLQRPRAYQMALLKGLHNFQHLRAKSSMTPSMCSGHCLQGLLAVGAVIEYFLHLHVTEPNWQAFQQYAVDIGDRRVMAGVHFPSDNIASWIIGMRLADHVYADQEVKVKLWEGIQNQSYVYEMIKKKAATESGAVYHEALEALHEAASTKI